MLLLLLGGVVFNLLVFSHDFSVPRRKHDNIDRFSEWFWLKKKSLLIALDSLSSDDVDLLSFLLTYSVTYATQRHSGAREWEAVPTVQRWNCVTTFITTATIIVGVEVPSSKSKDALLQRQQWKFPTRARRIPTCHSKVRAQTRAMHHQ